MQKDRRKSKGQEETDRQRARGGWRGRRGRGRKKGKKKERHQPQTECGGLPEERALLCGQGGAPECGQSWKMVLAGLLMLCLVAQSCPTLGNPMNCSPPGSSVHGDSPGKNTGVGSLSHLQRIFPTQESNWSLLHCRWILYQLSYLGLLSGDQNHEGPHGSCSLRSSDMSCGQLGGWEYCEVLCVLRCSLSSEWWRESQPCSGS